MPQNRLDPELMAQIGELRDGRIREVRSEEVVKVAQTIIAAMNADLPSVDAAVRADLEDLADYIQVAKAEILTLSPEEISDKYLPVATVELDAIVRATEEATNGIMEAAEGLEEMAQEVDAKIAERITDATTRIFEACSFQDITGQRIGKVVKALQEVEVKVENLIAIFGEDDPEGRAERRRRRLAERDAETPETLDDHKALMQGPQLPEDAIGQDDIDALFASLD